MFCVAVIDGTRFSTIYKEGERVNNRTSNSERAQAPTTELAVTILFARRIFPADPGKFTGETGDTLPDDEWPAKELLYNSPEINDFLLSIMINLA
ncbi:MAG: hypothetical protein BM485_09590 [Desulfobulbaceae bacterium DB1]|nr:MAG: hypothetical protein BM485_09590 [Desulfobulbaceae bacterium DB1]